MSVNLFQNEQPNKETNSPPAKTSKVFQIPHFIFSPTTAENLVVPVGSSEGKETSESRSHGNLSHAFPTFWRCSVWKGELSWRSALSKLAPHFIFFSKWHMYSLAHFFFLQSMGCYICYESGSSLVGLWLFCRPGSISGNPLFHLISPLGRNPCSCLKCWYDICPYPGLLWQLL